VCADDREALEAVLVDIERQTKVGSKKWHKLRSPERNYRSGNNRRRQGLRSAYSIIEGPIGGRP
jgi:hypothetical protein